MTYTAIYEREPDGRWTVDIPAVRGCHTYGRTIEQARERIREALGLYVDDADTAEIVDDIKLPSDIKRSIATAQKMRELAAKMERDMALAQKRAVCKLREFNLGQRDTGALLGMSFQRVHQLEQQYQDATIERVPGAVIERATRLTRRAVKHASKKR